MLVGGGVEDILGAMGLENLLHAHGVGDVSDDGVCLDGGVFAGHHESNLVEGRLGLVDENHLGWIVEGNLAHHFGTDAAGGAGDENAFAAEEVGHGGHVDLDFGAGEEVFDVDLAHVGVVDLRLAVPFGDGGHHEDMYTAFDEAVEHFLVGADDVALER